MSRRDNILLTPHKRLKGVQCGVAKCTQNPSRREFSNYEGMHKLAAKVRRVQQGTLSFLLYNNSLKGVFPFFSCVIQKNIIFAHFIQKSCKR